MTGVLILVAAIQIILELCICKNLRQNLSQIYKRPNVFTSVATYILKWVPSVQVASAQVP